MKTLTAPKMDLLIKDENFLCSMNFPPFGISLILHYQGTDKVAYWLFNNQAVLFSGNDYRPSPMFSGIDSIESCVALLSFLTLSEGDTDKEYFANYTPDQRKWSRSDACKELQTHIFDFEGGESEYLKDAIEFFQNAYTN